jgi:replicative DNA helicase
MAEPKLASVEQLKVPPHSIEAEQSVLGGILLAERGFEEVADRLSEEDFYREDHRLLYRAICELNDLGSPLDAVTVTEWFENNGQIDRVDGGAYIVQLTNTTPSAANITAYADIVREKSILRSLIDVGTLITSNAFGSEGRNSKELLEEAEKAIFAIADRGQRAGQGFVSVQDTLDEAFKRIQELVEQDGDITGIPTGFIDFDKKTAGLQDSDLVIVAGRPAMGKTTLAMNIAENAAIKSKVPVAVFSMEMSSLQLVMRLFSSLGQIEQGRLRTGNLDDLDWPKLTSAMNLLRKSKIFIDETRPGPTPEARARHRHDRHRLSPAHAGPRKQRKPGERDCRDFPVPQGPGQGVAPAGDRPVPAQPLPGAAAEQTARHGGPARVRLHRAGCGPHRLHLPGRGLQ